MHIYQIPYVKPAHTTSFCFENNLKLISIIRSFPLDIIYLTYDHVVVMLVVLLPLYYSFWQIHMNNSPISFKNGSLEPEESNYCFSDTEENLEAVFV